MPRLRLLLLASTLVLGVLAPLTPALATAGDTVSITSPTAGATATGIVTVNVQAAAVTPTAGDTVQLLVDNVQYGAARSCVSTALPCLVTFAWDSTGLSGTHTLVAVLSSNGSTQSAPVTVTAVNPAPTVTLSAPTPGQVVKGTLTVTALGTVDLTQNDAPVSLQLLIDGVKYGLPAACNVQIGTAKTCLGTFTVPTTGSSGLHSVQVTMATTVSSAASPVVQYDVFTALKASLTKLAPIRGGRSVVVSGHVRAAAGGAGVSGVRVKITLSPAVGKHRSLIVHTGSTGGFSVATKIAVGTAISASVAKTNDEGTAYALIKVAAYAPITCKVSKTLVQDRYADGTCTVPLLPSGTKVSLQYLQGKRWKVLGAGLTSGTAIPISFTFPNRGKYAVRLVLGASKPYLATAGVPFTITVT
ncbi:hypothetical protein acdb102_36280 [Acidothermaceae bacterium B102]|nr:hypothetical protein acdb102_36280 [Acidothermaceae bacterium B102]